MQDLQVIIKNIDRISIAINRNSATILFLYPAIKLVFGDTETSLTETSTLLLENNSEYEQLPFKSGIYLKTICWIQTAF